jgi:hypothetical protein
VDDVTGKENRLRQVSGGRVDIRHAGSASAPHQLHDRRPDVRRQAVPVRDKLAKGRVVPTLFRHARRAVFANGL